MVRMSSAVVVLALLSLAICQSHKYYSASVLKEHYLPRFKGSLVLQESIFSCSPFRQLEAQLLCRLGVHPLRATCRTGCDPAHQGVARQKNHRHR